MVEWPDGEWPDAILAIASIERAGLLLRRNPAAGETLKPAGTAMEASPRRWTAANAARDNLTTERFMAAEPCRHESLDDGAGGGV